MDEDRASDRPISERPSVLPPGPGERLGRRIAQVVYYVCVVTICTAATVQITRQLFFPPEPEPMPYGSCEAGLRALYDAVGAAQASAERVEGDDDEEAALNRYRETLAPAWRHRDAVAAACPSREHARLLDAIERLRYSEEHGVRHQAAELSALRKRVNTLVTTQLPSSP